MGASSALAMQNSQGSVSREPSLSDRIYRELPSTIAVGFAPPPTLILFARRPCFGCSWLVVGWFRKNSMEIKMVEGAVALKEISQNELVEGSAYL